MNRQVKKVLRSCEIWQQVKVNTSGAHTLLYPIIPRDMWELVALDFYGSMPKGWGGIEYILVILEC